MTALDLLKMMQAYKFLSQTVEDSWYPARPESGGRSREHLQAQQARLVDE
jgi:hypothetical protein